MEQGAPIQTLALGKRSIFGQIWKKENSACGNHLCFPAVAALSASLQPRSVQLKLEVIDFGLIISSHQYSIFLPSHIFSSLNIHSKAETCSQLHCSVFHTHFE